MPPKKQALKKGITYKPSIPSKDIVPASIKEPPREPRAIKPLPDFPDQEFKNEFQPKQKLEQWPGNEAAKNFDFGTELFSDPLNHLVTSFFSEKLVTKWKSMKIIEKLQSYQEEEEEEDDTSIHEIHSQNNVNYMYEDDVMQQDETQYKPKEPLIVQTILRDQTPQQIQKRKTIQLQKLTKDKKKPPPKKQDSKQQSLPQKVRDVQLADIETHNYMFNEARWIGGHLQLIKDKDLRDIYTGEPVWKKIYPQVDGVPVISKSGRYWVKLYHMGAEVKVEVDSELPIDNKCRYLFPLSKKHHEKWTLIMTKALIKLVAINNSPAGLCGDGITLYALTGLICETIPLNSFTDWNRLGGYLSDEHYTEKDIVATCFSTSKFKVAPPSNLVKTSKEKDYNKLFEFANSDFLPSKKRLERSNSGHLPVFEFDIDKDEPEVIETGVESDRSYLLSDYIFNGALNMAYVQNRSLKQMTLKQAYNELNQVSLSTKTKDQKLEHRKKKKELKEKIHRQEEKRLELMNLPNRPQHFIKVNSNIRIHCKYSKQELAIAKKCLVNGLLKPPNYEVYDPKEDTKSLMSNNLVVKKEEKQKDEMTVKALDDFSSLPHAIDPMERPEKGVWVQGDDFLRTFQYIQFYYNPQKLQSQIHKIEGQNGVQFTVDKSKEILLIEKQDNQQKTVILFGFAPEYPKQLKQAGRAYSILQKFNFDQYVAISGTPPLQDSLSSFRLELPNHNHLYKIVTVARSGYCYWFASNANFKLMSIASYLTEYQNYTHKQLSTDYLSAQANKYSLYFRLQITGGKEANILLVKLKGMDFNVLKYLRYKLIKPCEPNDKNLLLQDGKYFEEKALIVDIQNKIDIEPETKYYLLLEGVLPFDLKGNTVDIDIYTKSELKVELVENVEPLKYIEKYVPNKYGLICRERLFVNADSVATLLFQVVEADVPQKQAILDKKAPPPKKTGKEQGLQIPQTQLKQKRSVRFELYKGNQLIAAKMGSNITLISNIEILSTKNTNNNYYIQASFNLHEWPEAKDPEGTANICWSLKVTSSESIAVVRDTYQEDKDRDIKRSWEEQDPGRAERAKKSRMRYLAEVKQKNGEKLTEEEQALISQPKLTKKQILEEEKKMLEEKNKTKAAPKKDDKKGKKEEVKVVVQQQKIEVFPRSQNCVMTELKQYLKHLQSNRLIEVYDEGEARIRSEQDLRAIKQAALMSEQDRMGHIIRNIRNRQACKIQQSDRRQKFEIFTSKVKEDLRACWAEYTGKRNSLFEETKAKSQKDKVVISLLRGDKVLATEAQLQKTLKQYQSFQQHSKELLEGLQMLWKNKKISVLSDRLSNALPIYDIEEIKKIRGEIDTFQVEGISQELMQQMVALEEEFKANPNVIAEKQAELKKQKKGGKK